MKPGQFLAVTLMLSPGFEPGITVPKTVVISISPREQGRKQYENTTSWPDLRMTGPATTHFKSVSTHNKTAVSRTIESSIYR